MSLLTVPLQNKLLFFDQSVYSNQATATNHKTLGERAVQKQNKQVYLLDCLLMVCVSLHSISCAVFFSKWRNAFSVFAKVLLLVRMCTVTHDTQ